MKPLLPPAGLPTAPPPDQIKPMDPQGQPMQPKADPAAAEAAVDPDLDFRYLAVINGACDRLVVNDREVPDCAAKLVNVDFGNGRVAFMFSGREDDATVVTTFSGGASRQPDARAYHLTIDRMSMTRAANGGPAATVVVETEGTCTMTGDPTHEETRFECSVTNGGAETRAEFRTSGPPSVTAGAGRKRLPPDTVHVPEFVPAAPRMQVATR